MKTLLLSLLITNTPIMDRLAKLEAHLKCPFIVTSSNRTWEHNKRVGGAAASYHLLPNMALDVVPVCPRTNLEIGNIATNYFNGVIVYDSHLHLDLREVPYFHNNSKNR